MKLWCITLSEGYLLHAEPCCGVDTDFPDTGLGQGADVVLGLTEKCKVKARSTVTFDNLLTSRPLLDDLTELAIGALDILRQNRFHGVPVATKTTLEKKPRGSYDFATDGKNLDNKIVTCTTNYVTCNPVSAAQRLSKSAKKRVDIPMPKPFEDCNKQMGVVDLFDQFVSTYRVYIKSKKWWWTFLAWAKNTSMANARNLFRTVQKQKIGMLKFQREEVMTVLVSFKRNKSAKSLAFPQNVASKVKPDTKNHILAKSTSKYCHCKHCAGRSIYLCQKCNIALHPDCFKEHHS